MPTTNRKPARTIALAARTLERTGVAASVARIRPVPYSDVTAREPITTAEIWLKIRPWVMYSPGGSPLVPLAMSFATTPQTIVVKPAPMTIIARVVHHVERMLTSLIHSDLTVRPREPLVGAASSVVMPVLMVRSLRSLMPRPPSGRGTRRCRP